ncbi:type VI secretion system contractile sheath small subunit [Endozoicomonas sp. SM1973]|uniref:Type VI secretion system contractile sheath small subunit n=1 Tax=Spartinivicinus marinus TaxID=2994442 RepID=A0A853ICI4_9GAMM|nr:type VI secretion system contractile sheath small subunit [Spartinivicinus marinus]MCX4027991.1 type VI secretion system contractile sheath small subunit [Spartinivicinus marinus]NYZ68268.1 type VI secretion system contractile sheath small subunit [Spartinivicinus marinus]
MAKEGSVAPKERINVAYKPETGDAQEEVELPLKLMVVGDFTHREDDRLIEERKPFNVDKDNFNDVLKSQKISLDLAVASTLVDNPTEDDELEVNLRFENMRDFEPESIVRQVPELNQLLELRSALVALKGPLGNVPAFRKAIQGALADPASRETILKELGIDDTAE